MLLTTILAVVFILTMVLSFAYFTSSANANGAVFSFAKLQTQIAMNGSTFTNNGTINLGTQNLSQGSKVLTSVKVKTVADSTDSYIRVRVDFKATGDNQTKAQNMSVALNSLERTTPYTTATGTNYKWIYNDGYYYLVDNNGALLNATATTEYTLFDDTHTILCPDLQGLRLADNATLENVAINVVCEAVQSTNLNVSNNVESLHTKLKDNKIFEENVVGDYFVKFEANGGTDIPSQVVKANEKITLPKVGETEVQWYKGETLVDSSGKEITVNSDLTLIAHYGTNNNVFYVYFDLDGATTGDAPKTQTITYAESGSTIVSVASSNISKVGYTLSGWKVKGSTGENKIQYSKENGQITIPNNLTIKGTAVTIIPVWESVTYTITFDVGGDTSLTGQLEGVTGINKNSDGTYSLTYTINTTIKLPTLENADTQYSFMGWKVADNNATNVWQLADILRAGQTATGLYGDVVVKPLWGIEQIIKYEHSTIVKTYGDEDFINPITSIGASGVAFTYASSNTSIATVDGNTGKVTIVGVVYGGVNNTTPQATTITATAKNSSNETIKTITYTLTVMPRSISKVIVTNYEDTYTETGSAITPNVKLQDTTKGFLIANTDYTISYANNTSAGTARITLIGKGNYTGTRTIEFTIAKSKNLNDLKESNSLTISVTPKTYDGTNSAPSVTIINGSVTLQNGVDYLISTTNIDATATNGATVVIRGIGAYSGSITATFTIEKATLTIEGIKATDRIANGSTTVTVSGGTLTGVVSGESVGFVLSPATVASASAGANKAVTVTATLTGTADVFKNYTLTQPSGITVTISRPKITFNENGVGSFTGTTTLYGEYGTKDLYNANIGGTKVSAPTFDLTDISTSTFNGYWDSATGGTQMVGTDYKLISNFTNTSNVTWYAGVKSKLNEIYSETWTYTRGTFSQTMEANRQMASYGLFTPSTDNTGEFIQFGWYPQTIKESGVTITTTTKKFAGWDCYVGSDSCLYVKVASPTPYNSGNGCTYSNGTSCSTATELYFKLERIVWQILSDTSGSRLLYSVKELTSMPYYEISPRTISGTTIDSNNYKYSYVRAYLNGSTTYGPGTNIQNSTYSGKGLLQQAFTSAQSNLIKSTTVDNSASTTDSSSNEYACENTTDKIFLLSYKDLSSTYSRAVKNGSSSATRMKFPTDYAGAMGAERIDITSSTLYGGRYWLRSPYFDVSVMARDVYYTGTMGTKTVNASEVGVVPALYLSI